MKNKNQWLWTGALLLGVLSLFAFQQVPGDEDERAKDLSKFAREMLDLRYEELKENKLKQCKANALINAEIYVDSLVIKEATELKIGIEYIPSKPFKPNVPQVILEGDSLDVEPLFKDSLDQSGNQ